MTLNIERLTGSVISVNDTKLNLIKKEIIGKKSLVVYHYDENNKRNDLIKILNQNAMNNKDIVFLKIPNLSKEGARITKYSKNLQYLGDMSESESGKWDKLINNKIYDINYTLAGIAMGVAVDTVTGDATIREDNDDPKGYGLKCIEKSPNECRKNKLGGAYTTAAALAVAAGGTLYYFCKRYSNTDNSPSSDAYNFPSTPKDGVDSWNQGLTDVQDDNFVKVEVKDTINESSVPAAAEGTAAAPEVPSESAEGTAAAPEVSSESAEESKIIFFIDKCIFDEEMTAKCLSTAQHYIQYNKVLKPLPYLFITNNINNDDEEIRFFKGLPFEKACSFTKNNLIEKLKEHLKNITPEEKLKEKSESIYSNIFRGYDTTCKK